jgi:hypothetical protein
MSITKIEPRSARTELQTEADRIDCDLYRIISAVERLADRIPIAGAQLRAVAYTLHNARPGLRRFMHADDRRLTE